MFLSGYKWRWLFVFLHWHFSIYCIKVGVLQSLMIIVTCSSWLSQSHYAFIKMCMCLFLVWTKYRCCSLAINSNIWHFRGFNKNLKASSSLSMFHRSLHLVLHYCSWKLYHLYIFHITLKSRQSNVHNVFQHDAWQV